MMARAAGRTAVPGSVTAVAASGARGSRSRRETAHAHQRGKVRLVVGPGPISSSQSAKGTTGRSVAVGAAEQESCMLCTSVTATDVAGCLVQIDEAAAAGVDVVELRLDFLSEHFEVAELVSRCASRGVRSIATYRPTWEGGQYDGDEDARLQVLVEASRSGASYVDLEYKLGEERLLSLKREVGCGVIVSDHDYERTGSWEDLNRLVSSMRDRGADVAKVATTARSTSDAFRMLQLARQESGEGRPTIALAMGEAGLPSRLLAPKYGAFLTFGALVAGKESAPGQPSLRDMTQVYRLRDQDSETRVFGVIGDPIKHSMSPVIHNAAFGSIGENAVYLPFLVEDAEDFMQTFRAHDFSGCSVTIPHKERVGAHCDVVDEVAASIGAVNTVVSSGEGVLSASNTDWSAAISAIEEGLGGPGTLEGRRVCILGSGGTARALAFGAIARGASSVAIANRTLSKADALAAELGDDRVRAMSLGDLEGSHDSGGVLINTTSVGMSGENEGRSPVTGEVVSRFDLVFDAIYNPLETELLREASARGKATVSGVEMFIGQAEEQFRLFTGGKADPPVGLMREVVMSRLSKN